MRAKKAVQNKTSLPPLKVTPKSKDLPSTQGMLQLVRSEVKSNIRELRSEMNSKFAKVDARFDKVDARFGKIDARFNEVDASINEVKASINEVKASVEQVMQAVHHVAAEVSRIGVLVEEQNSKNNIVLEGHTLLAQRQDRIESRFGEVENTVRSISKHRTQ